MFTSSQRGRVPRTRAGAVASPSDPTFDPATRQVLKAHELARRWGLSEKTLERWRTEGRGPKYLKLGGRICYPLSAVFEYERAAGRISTSETDE